MRISRWLPIISLIFIRTAFGDTLWNYSTDSLAVRMIIDTANIIDHYVAPFESVYDSSNGRIRKLDLFNIGLTRLDAVIGHLTALDTLNIGGNLLKSFPREIYSLINLNWLCLTGNDTNALSPEIGNLINLRYLEASGMGIYFPNSMHTLPPEIGKLKQLRSLTARASHLDSLPHEIGQLTELRALDVMQCKLTRLPREIGNLRKLEIADFSMNQLDSLPNEIGEIANISYLFLGMNHLHNLPDSIINLQRATAIDSNYICSPSCRVQEWLDAHAIGGLRWRSTQWCPQLPVPPCSSSAALPRISERSIRRLSSPKPSVLYDMRGRLIAAQSPGGLSCNGVYISVYPGYGSRAICNLRIMGKKWGGLSVDDDF